MDLTERLSNRDSRLLLFSITPPRRTTQPDDAQRIADITVERLRTIDVDGLILYDIDDESDRNPEERPFPYLPTMDPGYFHTHHLAAWDRPVVVYRCVGKYDEATLKNWLTEQDPRRVASVFVGASSSSKAVHVSLRDAQALRRDVRPDLPLGAVAIPERHSRGADEHLRMLRKQESGCAFFVTQVVYDADAAKSMVSDYHYECAARRVRPVPVIFTLSVCGSLKTLAFLEWLGVDVPRWMRNDLDHTDAPLTTSYDHCAETAHQLAAFCERLGIPYGFNVESVSIRRAEIDASVDLATHLRREHPRHPRST
ncbi:methylenetetrahydrofolate reductase [Phytoactinopolyspora limicola]|uniref:methylenetetrahydrofolate reductase n=1 Tax=Phytoactinopolyspora limicola TaxID=2715536 RepID=UPI001407D5BF|nr:methylenetetrahydrofolate reductase [Phytoactinopolyspora limicola]